MTTEQEVTKKRRVILSAAVKGYSICLVALFAFMILMRKIASQFERYNFVESIYGYMFKEGVEEIPYKRQSYPFFG